MKRCASCGRRIWSRPVSIPVRGDYHYECAKNDGVLPKELEGIYEKAEELVERAARGEDVESLVQEMKDLETRAKAGRNQTNDSVEERK